jgi:hypothetical protein
MAAITIKLGIVMILFSLLTFFSLYFLTSVGNDYGVTVESIYNDKFGASSSGLSGGAVDVAYNASDVFEGADVDSQSQDVAQARGALTAGETNLDYKTVAGSFFSDLVRIFPFNPAVIGALAAILTVLTIGAGVYLFTGRMP